jgi:RNA polymerase-associated protein RTF1
MLGIESDGGDGKYPIEFKGREVTEDRVLRVKYGKVERLFRIADVSNGDFEEVCPTPTLKNGWNLTIRPSLSV